MKRWIAVMVVVCACQKDTGRRPTPRPSPGPTHELDALWAKAPAGATIGVVVSPRGIAMLEHAWTDVHGYLKTFPEFAPAEHEMATELAEDGLTTDLTLSALGLAPGKGFAVFVKGEHALMLIPVVDRDRFVKISEGTRGADGDHIDDLVCKPVDGWYTCTDDPGMLATMGKGDLRHRLDGVQARGEIEGVITSPVQAAAVLQLSPGTVVVRGIVDGLPGALLRKLGAPVAPHVDVDHTAGFATMNIAELLADSFPRPLVDGVTSSDLVHAVAGPLTMIVPAGRDTFDLRVPLSDTAPFRKVLDHCVDLLGARGATSTNGVCHIPLPTIAVTYDLSIDGNDLRVSYGSGEGPAVKVPASPFAHELATGRWQVAFWGRGTPLARSAIHIPPFVPATDVPIALRAAMMVNEIGAGASIEHGRVRVIATVRTAWANPDAVVAKLAAIPAADVLADRTGVHGKAIMDAAPGAPFANDYRAGLAGLGVPIAGVGALAGITTWMVQRYAGGAPTPPGRALAQRVVHKYAFEAFPQWAVAHPQRACPAALGQLDAYVDGLVTPDPWGHAYQMACGAKLPAGAKGIAVWSAGPDGQTGTADDVTSWK